MLEHQMVKEFEGYIQNEEQLKCMEEGDCDIAIHIDRKGEGLGKIKVVISSPLKIGELVVNDYFLKAMTPLSGHRFFYLCI